MRKVLVGHHCTTAQKRGWDAIQNGELLLLAESEFDVFITCDQNLRYQQNLSNRTISILELSTNDLRRILAASDLVVAVIASLKDGDYHRLEIA